MVYLRWESPIGWVLGTIKAEITKATPKLFKKFNYRVEWIADKAKGPANLPLDNYSHGPTAPY